MVRDDHHQPKEAQGAVQQRVWHRHRTQGCQAPVLVLRGLHELELRMRTHGDIGGQRLAFAPLALQAAPDALPSGGAQGYDGHER